MRESSRTSFIEIDHEEGVRVPDGYAQDCERAINAALKAEGLGEYCYARLMVTDNEHIRGINREYRNTDRATDVLSFPSTDASPARTLKDRLHALRAERDETGACFLGDIFLSLERAAEQASEYGHSVRRENVYLTVHALCHLMGYDHMKDDDRKNMRIMEEKIMSELGIARITDEELIQAATDVMHKAYAPYSDYRVGAALLARDGRVFTGCNVENAAFGAGICAERTALFKAVSEGAREFTVIAIAAEKSMPWPCGVCRQALNEFAPELRVIASCNGQKDEMTLSQLLPHGFGPKDL